MTDKEWHVVLERMSLTALRKSAKVITHWTGRKPRNQTREALIEFLDANKG